MQKDSAAESFQPNNPSMGYRPPPKKTKQKNPIKVQIFILKREVISFHKENTLIHN